MAGFVDIRGSGLARAQRTLVGLEEHPERLDLERRRFSDSPPPYKSDMSGTTTRSQSPNPPTEEQRLRQQRRMQLGRERVASKPDKQFSAQVEEERRRIWNRDPRTSGRELTIASLYTFQEEARENVKKRWVEQGIWNNNWNYYTIGRWKHEEPLELESESETDTEAESSRPPFSFLSEPQKPKRAKSDEKKRQIAKRRIVREREREASRPYHQFVYQVSKERERIQKESANGEGADAADINTKAYEIVKNTWTKRGIWNKKWGVLPGMSWKHEQPFEEMVCEEIGDDFVLANPLVNGNHKTGAPTIRLFGSSPVESSVLNSFQQGQQVPTAPTNPLVNGSHEAGETPAIIFNRAPLQDIFGRPITSLSQSGIFMRNPGESNHLQASGALNSPQQELPMDIDSAGSKNGDAERSPSTPNSPPLSPGKRVLRPMTSRSSKKIPSHTDEQLASAYLGPIHSSKVSKAFGKRKGPQRRLNISKKVSPNSLPLSSGVDAAEPQPSLGHVTPRRSKRIQPPVSSVAKDPAKTASKDPSKRAVRSKPEREVTSNPTTKGSVKPQGISKRPLAKTTHGKARGK